MAKADKKADKAKKEVKEEKAEAKTFKYGVEDLADKLDIKPASVRVQLRNKGIEKAGKSYGWDTKAELDEVAAQLKTKDEGEKPAKADKGAKKDKAAGKDKKKAKKAD